MGGIRPAGCGGLGLRSKEVYFQAVNPKGLGCFKAKAELERSAAIWPRVATLCWIKTFENRRLLC